MDINKMWYIEQNIMWPQKEMRSRCTLHHEWTLETLVREARQRRHASYEGMRGREWRYDCWGLEVSIWGDEHVLELDGDSCTVLWICWKQLNGILSHGLFMVCEWHVNYICFKKRDHGSWHEGHYRRASSLLSMGPLRLWPCFQGSYVDCKASVACAKSSCKNCVGHVTWVTELLQLVLNVREHLELCLDRRLSAMTTRHS